MRPPDVEQALRRLFGPDGPDIDCDACFAQIDRYVELELNGDDPDRVVHGMRAHLQGCASCREQYESLRGFLGGETS
jgi:hypothetical protein